VTSFAEQAKGEGVMPIHSKFKRALLKAGIVLAICGGLTVVWQGRVNGFPDAPTAEEIDISRAFPKLRAGPYQDNLAIQVIDEVI
jgi:hypothetical protein